MILYCGVQCYQYIYRPTLLANHDAPSVFYLQNADANVDANADANAL